MSMMLPTDTEGLINLLLVLTAGDVFPKADEDMLRNLADRSRNFGENLAAEVSGLDSLVSSVVQGLDTPAGRQFVRYGHNLDKFGVGLLNQAQQIGDFLEDFGLNAENAKYQMVIGSTITASMIAWGFASPWGAALIPTWLSTLRTFIIDVFGRYWNTMTAMLWGAATESVQELGSAFLSQVIQVAEGNRKVFDTEDLGLSAGIGAGAGFVAPLIGAVVNATPNAFKKQWQDVAEQIKGTHKPPTPPSTVFQVTTNSVTEGITELVVSAATLPLGGSITGLGLSTISGLFSGFTETAADIKGEQIYAKYHKPTPPPPGGGGADGKPNQGVHNGQVQGASPDDGGPPPLVTEGASNPPDPNQSNAVSSDTDPSNPNSPTTTAANDDDPLGVNQPVSPQQPPSPGSSNTAVQSADVEHVNDPAQPESVASNHGTAAAITGNPPPAASSSAPPAGNNNTGTPQQPRSSTGSIGNSSTGSGLEDATHSAVQPHHSALSSGVPDTLATASTSTSLASVGTAPPPSTSSAPPSSTSAPPSSTSSAPPSSTSNSAPTSQNTGTGTSSRDSTDSGGDSVTHTSSTEEHRTHSPVQPPSTLSSESLLTSNGTMDGDIVTDNEGRVEKWLAQVKGPEPTMRVPRGWPGPPMVPAIDSGSTTAADDANSIASSDFDSLNLGSDRAELERPFLESDWSDTDSTTSSDTGPLDNPLLHYNWGDTDTDNSDTESIDLGSEQSELDNPLLHYDWDDSDTDLIDLRSEQSDLESPLLHSNRSDSNSTTSSDTDSINLGSDRSDLERPLLESDWNDTDSTTSSDTGPLDNPLLHYNWDDSDTDLIDLRSEQSDLESPLPHNNRSDSNSTTSSDTDSIDLGSDRSDLERPLLESDWNDSDTGSVRYESLSSAPPSEFGSDSGDAEPSRPPSSTDSYVTGGTDQRTSAPSDTDPAPSTTGDGTGSDHTSTAPSTEYHTASQGFVTEDSENVDAPSPGATPFVGEHSTDMSDLLREIADEFPGGVTVTDDSVSDGTRSDDYVSTGDSNRQTGAPTNEDDAPAAEEDDQDPERAALADWHNRNDDRIQAWLNPNQSSDAHSTSDGSDDQANRAPAEGGANAPEPSGGSDSSDDGENNGDRDDTDSDTSRSGLSILSVHTDTGSEVFDTPDAPPSVMSVASESTDSVPHPRTATPHIDAVMSVVTSDGSVSIQDTTDNSRANTDDVINVVEVVEVADASGSGEYHSFSDTEPSLHSASAEPSDANGNAAGTPIDESGTDASSSAATGQRTTRDPSPDGTNYSTANQSTQDSSGSDIPSQVNDSSPAEQEPSESTSPSSESSLVLTSDSGEDADESDVDDTAEPERDPRLTHVYGERLAMIDEERSEDLDDDESTPPSSVSSITTSSGEDADVSESGRDEVDTDEDQPGAPPNTPDFDLITFERDRIGDILPHESVDASDDGMDSPIRRQFTDGETTDEAREDEHTAEEERSRISLILPPDKRNEDRSPDFPIWDQWRNFAPRNPTWNFPERGFDFGQPRGQSITPATGDGEATIEVHEDEHTAEEERSRISLILPPDADEKKEDSNPDPDRDQMRGVEGRRPIFDFPERGLDFDRRRGQSSTPAVIMADSSPRTELPQFQHQTLMASDNGSDEAQGGGDIIRRPEQLPRWRQVQLAAEARRAEREPARQQPPAPPRPPEQEIELQLPPSAAIVSIGVPKGRLPATRGLIRTIQDSIPRLRRKPVTFWTNFERELLSKHRQISFDSRRRREGAPPPVSHPFQIDDLTLFISLSLDFVRRLPDASAARDGIPGAPGADKRGRVEGVDTVNGQYDLGPTIRPMSGDTTYTALNLNPNFAFPNDFWRPGVSFGLEAEMNKSLRSIADLTDAEYGSVEDDRVGVEYLIYRPRWVVRVLDPNLTFRDVLPPVLRFPMPGDNEVLVLGVARPYVEPSPTYAPARLEEVLDIAPPADNAPAQREQAPAIVVQDQSLQVPKPAKLIKNRPAEADDQDLQPVPEPPRPRPEQLPDRDLSALPDHYFASGLTGIDKLYQHALSLLSRNDIADVDTASIITKVWALEANLHNATRRGGGYRFPVFNKNAKIVALFEINTTLFPGGFRAAHVELAHDDADGNAPRFGVDFPPVQLVGGVSDLAHIEDVATAIDGLSGGHTLAQSIGGNVGFSALVKKPGDSKVGMSAALNLQLKTGNTNGISTSRNSLWVHVARFVGRTGAYSIPMVHQIRLIDPDKDYQPSRTVPGAGMVRVPESEAARRNWPLERESPFRNIQERDRGAPGNMKDFSRGVGMGLVRLPEHTAPQLHDFLSTELAREGFLHNTDARLEPPTMRNDGVRRHKQLENAITLDKLVSHAALRANYDMAHQGGFTFTLEVPSENVLPHVPNLPGVAGRMRSAKITISATQSNDPADQRRPRDPTFVQTTRDFHTVNLAMGMTTVGQTFGGSVSGKVGGKFSIFKDLLRNFGVLGGGYTYSRGANNEAKLLNNRPELLEYAHEVEEWEVYSDWHVQIEFQDAPILTRTLPPSRLLNQPFRLMNQEARVHTLDFVNGGEKDIAPLNPNANLGRRHRHFLDNAVVYKLDTTGMRRELSRMLRPFTGPAGYADQELNTMAGTTNMRAFLKEAIRDGIFTELPFIPGWFKDKHGSVSIKADMQDVEFDGATRESFTLGIIKLGLVSTSMGHNESHSWGSDMFDFNLGAQVNTADVSGGINPEHRQTWGTAKNASREGSFERIQLRFGPAYKFRIGIRYRIETSMEYGGKFIPGNLIANVTRRQAEESPVIAPALLEAAERQGIEVLPPDRPLRAPRPDLPPRTPDGARIAPLAAAPRPDQGGQDGAPAPMLEDRFYDIDSEAEFLVPERDALIGFTRNALPISSPQLTDVMTRYVETQPGNAPPIGGTLAAKVLLRWHQLEPQAAIHDFARRILDLHRSDDQRFTIADQDVAVELAALAPEVVLTLPRELPFTEPYYLTREPQNRILGHSGITSVTYQRFDDGGNALGHTSLYEAIVRVVHNVEPRALDYDIVDGRDGQRHTRSKLKPIQGVSEGLASVLGRGRDDMFVDDLLHDKGLTFQLVHPTNWLNAEILEISVQMRLKNHYQWGDVAPTAGTENFTHGYTGQSSTVSKSDSMRLNGKLTAARAPNTHVGTGTGRASLNNGYSRSLSTGTTVVSEQTVFDWGGHVELDITHETIVTVRRFYMNERFLNNVSLATFNRGTVLLRHQEHLYGTLSLEVPMSIAMGRVPPPLPAPTSGSRFVGKLPGDATVAGNTLDGLMPAAQRMLNRIEGKFWTLSNARNSVAQFVGITPFTTSPSAIMQSLLARTQLNGHIPAAIGGGVHRLAENMIIPGHPDYLIDVDMFGELIRVEHTPYGVVNRPEVVLESTGSGSGRYNKFISNTSHSLKVDNFKGSAGFDAGYSYNHDANPPDAKEPRIDQVAGGGLDSTRTTATGTSGIEIRGRRDEQHIKQVVPSAAAPDAEAGPIVGIAANPDAEVESMLSVKFIAKFRLTANVRNRNLPGAMNPWTETFRTNWVEGDVYVTLTKSQYIAMMNTDYDTPNHFWHELMTVAADPTLPQHSREIDGRFHAPDFLPHGFEGPDDWPEIDTPEQSPPNRLGLLGSQFGGGIQAPPPLPRQPRGLPRPPFGSPGALSMERPFVGLPPGRHEYDPDWSPPPLGMRPRFDSPDLFGSPASGPDRFDSPERRPHWFGSPNDPQIYGRLQPSPPRGPSPDWDGESLDDSPPRRPQAGPSGLQPRRPQAGPSHQQPRRPVRDPGQPDRMRRFFTQGGPSRLGDHLITALDRYADAGILDHFAHLPNQGLADAALAEVMRRTAHLDDMDVVRDAFQLFGRATMLHRFNYASEPAALEQFVAEFMDHVDRLRRGFYLQNGLDPESPQRSVSHWSLSPQASSQLSTIVEEDETEEEDFYTPPEAPAGEVPVEPSSSDERRGPAGRTPWPMERARLDLPPEWSPATNLGSFELLRRPPAGSNEQQDMNLDHMDLTPPSSPEDNAQLRAPQDEQRERILDQVARIREHYNHADEIRFWQLAHHNVAGTLDDLPNRALADRFMIQLILHEDNLAREFNRIGRDQVEQIFANGTRWTAMDVIRLLVALRARPYPRFRQEDIWAYVGSFLPPRP